MMRPPLNGGTLGGPYTMRFSERWTAEAANRFEPARAAGVAATLDDFLQTFHRLRRFGVDRLLGIPLPPDSVRWLVEEGLPEEAAPWLGLESATNVLRPIGEVWPLLPRDAERLSHSYSLYTDGSGNPIVIDTQRHGALFLLDHESGLAEVCFVNASVIALAESLLIRMKPIPFEQMLLAIAALDQPATAPGTFWHTHLVGRPTSR